MDLVAEIVNAAGRLNFVESLALIGFYIPFLTGLMLMISNYSRLHDVSTLLLSAGIVQCNLLNSLLNMLLRVPCKNALICTYGQPAREPQMLFFFIAFDLLFSHYWSRKPLIGIWVTLTVAAAWSSGVYIQRGYYTAGQVAGGAFVGALLGLAYGSFVRLVIIPSVDWYVASWDGVCNGHWWIPRFFQVTHAFHFHPGKTCYVPNCEGRTNYTIVHCIEEGGAIDLGVSNIPRALIKLTAYSLLHYHTS